MKKETRRPRKTAKRRMRQAPDSAMKYHLIDKYRQSIAKRYDYKNIKDNPTLPGHISPEIAETLRNYFLNNLYPEPVSRQKLDAAFTELENFALHPGKVWGLFGNITHAIFRFGFQFPAAIKAGMVSLESYTSAKHFENDLARAAMDMGFTVPLTDDQFYACMTSIPHKDLERFITELEHLFRSFTHTTLLAKTIAILEDVLNKMKSKKDVYGPNETEAIELGIDILNKGYALFIQYDDDVRKEILEFIATNERNFIRGLYKERSK